MAFDITTTMVWASLADQINPDREADNYANLDRMISEGKTDGSFFGVMPTVTIRYWRDLAAAEEFAAFLTANAAKHNCHLVSIEYGTRESTAHLLD